MAGMMMESMDLQPFHFFRLYNPPRRLTFPGVPYLPLSLLTMTDKIEKVAVLQLMELVDDGMKDRLWMWSRFVSFGEVARLISIHVAQQMLMLTLKEIEHG